MSISLFQLRELLRQYDSADISISKFVELINDHFKTELKLGMYVYHKNVYWGKERFKIVGIREHEVELEGDWSGGTNDVCQKGWVSIEGLLFELNKEPIKF
jgi:hypothetical protein